MTCRLESRAHTPIDHHTSTSTCTVLFAIVCGAQKLQAFHHGDDYLLVIRDEPDVKKNVEWHWHLHAGETDRLKETLLILVQFRLMISIGVGRWDLDKDKD